MLRAPTVATRVAILVVAVLLCLCVFPTEAISGGGATSTMRVAFTQVMHRHGARSPQPSYNQTFICRDAPCGYLTYAGTQELVNVGAFLRERYNDESIVVEPFFPTTVYNVSVLYSRSTDVFRTLQSAEAFLHGLYPNLDESFPAIHTMTEDDDLLLNTNAQPWLHYFYKYNKDLVHAATDPVTDRLYPGERWRELTELGRMMGAEGYCSSYETRSDCARTVFDFAACWEAMNELDPLIKGNFSKVQEITRALFAYEYRYTNTNDLMAKQGGRGREFLNEAVQNVDDFIAGTNTYRMMHYSAHDTTLAPIWGTLGDETETGMLPPFAQIFVMELLQDPAGSPSDYHVRILRAHPGQTYEDWTINGFDDTWAMKCMNTAGQIYPAADNTCPLADFKAYYATSAPTDERGYCYMDDKTWAIADCPSGGVTTPNAPALQQSGAVAAPVLSTNCQFYRNVCPAYACDDGFVVEKSTLQCVCSTSAVCAAVASSSDSTTTSTTPSANPPGDSGTGSGEGDNGVVININSDKNHVSAGATAGIAIATFCVGALIASGVVAGIFVCCTRRRKPDNEVYRAGDMA